MHALSLHALDLVFSRSHLSSYSARWLPSFALAAHFCICDFALGLLLVAAPEDYILIVSNVSIVPFHGGAHVHLVLVQLATLYPITPASWRALWTTLLAFLACSRCFRALENGAHHSSRLPVAT